MCWLENFNSSSCKCMISFFSVFLHSSDYRCKQAAWAKNENLWWQIWIHGDIHACFHSKSAFTSFTSYGPTESRWWRFRWLVLLDISSLVIIYFVFNDTKTFDYVFVFWWTLVGTWMLTTKQLLGYFDFLYMLKNALNYTGFKNA